MLRKLVGFFFAFGLLAGGTFIIIRVVLYGTGTSLVTLAGAAMFVSGGAWLWGDYILPLLKRG